MSAEGIVRQVEEFVERDHDWIVDMAARLVRIPSVNPKFHVDPALNREADVQDLLEGALRQEGLGIERWDVLPGRPNMVARLPGERARSLILLGHIDVVPTGDLSRWTVDPFGGEVKNGRLYGRGAVDMKGGVAACVAAVRAIRRCGIELEGALSIHSVVDEEAGGFGAIDAVRRGHQAAAVLVAEPSWGDVMPCEGGVEWVRVTFRGRNAHASWRYNEIFPQRADADRLAPGVNAIEIAARFIEATRRYELDRTRARSHPLLPLGANTINVGVIHGGAGLGANGLPVTTTNPAMTPDVAVVDLNMMFLPNETSAEVRRDFERFIHHFGQTDAWLRDNPPAIEWELSDLFFPPFDTPVAHPLVQSLVRRKGASGRTPAVKGFVAVTDGAHYAAKGMDPVIFGPSGDGLHGVDEFVDIDSMVETARVIAASVIDWCGAR